MRTSHTIQCLLLGMVAVSTAFASAEESLQLPITRDTWFSRYGSEADANLGGASRLKLKSNQEMSLVDFDPAPLKGRAVKSATLHLKLSGDESLGRVTVGTFASPWVEGTSPRYASQDGASCFNFREYPDTPWTLGGGDLCHVVLGQGGTTWASNDARIKDGWAEIPVAPRVVMARAVNVSYGLFLFDDTGSEWTRDGEEFNLHLFPNRYVYSKDQNAASAPYLTVELGAEDTSPPDAPEFVEGEKTAFHPDLEISRLQPGVEIFRWTTPNDNGPSGVVGFNVTIDGQPVPRYLIPAAKPGKEVVFRLRDLPISRDPSVEHTLAVQAIDGAGNVSEAIQRTFRRCPIPEIGLPELAPAFMEQGGQPLKLGATSVFIVDPLDKVHPVTGRMTPPQDELYRTGNHLFSAKRRSIRLAAARNEFTGMQIVFDGPIRNVKPSLTFDDAPEIDVAFSRFHCVNTPVGPMPDAVMPLDESGYSVPDAGHAPQDARFGSILCELYVPHDTPPGKHSGTLTLATDENTLSLNVDLWVWNMTLPDELSFLPEMNTYGLGAAERDYYRLAHTHRTVLNRVPYGQNGTLAQGCAPIWDGESFDWTAWDERFGSLLDGSAFEDLPRAGVPIECLYLPLHENWPSPMEGNYNGSYWADEAFPESYRHALVGASRQMARHFQEKGYNRTIFQCYQNNKNNFKARGWSRGSSPWLLDEPSNFQDYWALYYFAQAFREGVDAALGETDDPIERRPIMAYRTDISRPQWQRELFDDLQQYAVVGGSAFRKYHTMVLDRKEEFGQMVIPYGSTNAIEDSNMQPVGWCLDSFLRGGDGVLPWQTVGKHESWQEGDRLSLFYPGSRWNRTEPYPSIRLKAYRRGQQDVEYANLLCKRLEASPKAYPEWLTKDMIRRAIALEGQHGASDATAAEDAGVTTFESLKPQDAWRLRIHMARTLELLEKNQ